MLQVSYVAYGVCKFFGLDYSAAARGGLLHDFFLYDWKEYKAIRKKGEANHGRMHPHIALENSLEHFALSEKEKDIIVTHMWPKTYQFPRYI